MSEPIECLDHGTWPCEGKVEYRMSMSPSGRSFPRCDRHRAKRLDFEQETTEKYTERAVEFGEGGSDRMVAAAFARFLSELDVEPQ